MLLYLPPLNSRFKMVVVTILCYLDVWFAKIKPHLESCSVHWSVIQSGRHTWFLTIFPKCAGDRLPCHFLSPERTEDHSPHKAAGYLAGSPQFTWVLCQVACIRMGQNSPHGSHWPAPYTTPQEVNDTSRLCCGPHWTSILLGYLILRKSQER